MNTESSTFNPGAPKPTPTLNNAAFQPSSTPAFVPNNSMPMPQAMSTPQMKTSMQASSFAMNPKSSNFTPSSLNQNAFEFKPTTPAASQPPQQMNAMPQPAPKQAPVQGFNYQNPNMVTQPQYGQQYQYRQPQYPNVMPTPMPQQQPIAQTQPFQQKIQQTPQSQQWMVKGTTSSFTPPVNNFNQQQPAMNNAATKMGPINNGAPVSWNNQTGKPQINSQFKVENQIKPFAASSLSVGAFEFKPSFTPQSASAEAFKPASSSKSEAPAKKPEAPAKKPEPKKPEPKKPEPKKAEQPPKDKLTVILERVVDTGVDLKELKEVFETQKVKSEGKWSSDLLRQFMSKVSKEKVADEVKDCKCYINGLQDREMEEKSLKQIDSMRNSNFKRGGQQKGNRNYQNDYNNQGRGRGRGRGGNDNYQANRPQEEGGNMSIGGNVNYSNRHDKRDKFAPENEFERKATDDMTSKLKQQAVQALQTAKQDKNVEQQIRLICNIIAPDNYDKKFAELRQFMFADLKASDEDGFDAETDLLKEESINKEQMNLIVRTIFRKAQNEPEYSNFYSHLCTQLTRLELRLRGIEPTVKNLSKCEFRKILLQFCKENFLALINQKEETSKQDEEAILRHKLKLFGNMKFVGELYIQYLIIDKIILNIFESLLGVNGVCPGLNDDTAEGAIMLINKVGVKFDEKMRSFKAKDAGASYEAIYTQFAMLRDEAKETSLYSLRVQLLIKNMLENQESGWKKRSQEEEKFKTKKDIQMEMMAKKNKEEDEKRQQRGRHDYYEDDDGYQKKSYNNNSNNSNNLQKQGSTYSNKNDNKQQYRKKDTNRGDQPQNNRRQTNDRRRDQQKTRQDITQEEVQQKVKEFFKGFFDAEEEFDLKAGLNSLDEITKNTQINGKPTYGEEVLFQLFNSVMDYNNVQGKLLQVMNEFITNNTFNTRAFQGAVNKFLAVIGNWAADVPNAHEVFTKSIIKPLLENNLIRVNEIKWFTPQEEEEEDEYFEADVFYKILVDLLIIQFEKDADWDKVKSFYQKDVQPSFKAIQDKGELPDFLIDEIKAEHGDKAVKAFEIIKQ